MMLLSVIITALFSSITANPFEYDYCPPNHEDLLPCTCVRNVFYCWKKGITKEQFFNAVQHAVIPQMSLKVRGIDFGNLYYENISYITAEAFELKNCELKSLGFLGDPRYTSLSLSYTLKNLTFINSIDDTDGDVELHFDTLEKLEELDFANNEIKHLRKDWFPSGLKSLTRLTLHKNNIETIDEYAFANLTKLRALTLDGNNLKFIERSYLPYPGYHLEVLNLNFNHIENFTKDAFSDLVSLSKLYLSHNYITKLSEDTWEEVWSQLKVLTLDGNPLDCAIEEVRWILQIRRPKYLLGKCTKPKSKENVNLALLIDKRGRVSNPTRK